jgi:16S rRNA (cytosine1402-N4)-methyltransferase
MINEDYVHTPVLLNEVLHGLDVRADGVYVDCTFGRGGHSRAILDRLGNTGSLLVLDKDPDAIKVASQLASTDSRLQYFHAPFSSLAETIRTTGRAGAVDGILFDLGVSSPQLDDSGRGFSFSRDGYLDMRMDPGSGTSAADWINSASQEQIANVLRVYGEEKFYRRISSAIVIARSQQYISTTSDLANIISSAVPSRELKRHPATRAFQAIRIYINSELEEITAGLSQAFEMLRINGRLLAISFHSLEDRIVKRFMREYSHSDPYPKDIPVTADMIRPRMKILGKAIRPGYGEVAVNPRSRSAVLRMAEKLTA